MRIENIKRITIEIKNEYSYEITCGGCPTILEFQDIDEHKLYFRLRHGHWRLFDETLNEVLVSGDTDKYDGVCDWDDALEMMQNEGVCFTFEE